jgi:ABC-type polysaccharide/polyol phosphate export permease
MPSPLSRAASLVWLLSRENFRVRYKRASLGVFWAVVQPTLQAAVLIFVFTHIIRYKRVDNYAIYMLSGILPWTFFSQSVIAATSSIVDNSALIKKVPVPAVVFPLAGVGGATVTYGISVTILVVGSAIFHTFGLHLLLLPIAFLSQVFVITAIALVTSSLYPAFRDIRYIVDAVLLIGLYITPIIWDPASIGSHTLRFVMSFNPMYAVILMYHSAVAARTPDWPAMAPAGGTTLCIMIAGVLLFRHRQGEFPDVV